MILYPIDALLLKVPWVLTFIPSGFSGKDTYLIYTTKHFHLILLIYDLFCVLYLVIQILIYHGVVNKKVSDIEKIYKQQKNQPFPTINHCYSYLIT